MSEQKPKPCVHEWEVQPYILLSCPSQSERICKHCGAKQWKFDTPEGKWRDPK